MRVAHKGPGLPGKTERARRKLIVIIVEALCTRHPELSSLSLCLGGGSNTATKVYIFWKVHKLISFLAHFYIASKMNLETASKEI